MNDLKKINSLCSCSYSVSRRWTINGSIPISGRKLYFYASVRKQNEEILLPSIRERGKYIMCHAARASGKTTRMEVAIEQLKEENKYHVLQTSFQSGVDFDTKRMFWNSFGSALKRDNASFRIPTIKSGDDFLNVFSTPSSPFDKPVVLFVDEFDMLYSVASDEVQDSMLNVLRHLKQRPDLSNLQAFVGIGPYSVLQLIGKSSSPFNIRDAIKSPPLTLEQVEDLFQQFEKERGMSLDKRIVLDVYARTEGHAGCVCYCGKVIDEELLRNASSVSYATWMRYATKSLDRRIIKRWPTMMKMVDEFDLPENELVSEQEQKRIPLVKKARELLCFTYLTTQDAVEVSHGKQRLTNYLAAEGVLESSGDYFKVRSPLIRSILVNCVLPLLRRAVPCTPPPISKEKLDVGEALKTAICYFRIDVILNQLAKKKSRAPRQNGLTVPQEDVYQIELLSILKFWLPQNVRITSQPNAVRFDDERTMKRSKPDIHIRNPDGSIVLIELVAHCRVSDITTHIRRVTDDAKVLGASEAWVLHFTTGEFKVWPVGDLAAEIPVHVMHVKHDLDWKALTVVIDNDFPENVQIQKQK